METQLATELRSNAPVFHPEISEKVYKDHPSLTKAEQMDPSSSLYRVLKTANLLAPHSPVFMVEHESIGERLFSLRRYSFKNGTLEYETLLTIRTDSLSPEFYTHAFSEFKEMILSKSRQRVLEEKLEGKPPRVDPEETKVRETPKSQQKTFQFRSWVKGTPHTEIDAYLDPTLFSSLVEAQKRFKCEVSLGLLKRENHGFYEVKTVALVDTARNRIIGRELRIVADTYPDGSVYLADLINFIGTNKEDGIIPVFHRSTNGKKERLFDIFVERDRALFKELFQNPNFDPARLSIELNTVGHHSELRVVSTRFKNSLPYTAQVDFSELFGVSSWYDKLCFQSYKLLSKAVESPLDPYKSLQPTFGSGTSRPFQAKVLEEVREIPWSVAQDLNGIRFEGVSSIQDSGGLLEGFGVTPAGTYGMGKISIAEFYRDNAGNRHNLIESLDGIMDHEIGHHLNIVLGTGFTSASSLEEFRVAYNLDLARAPRLRELRYFLPGSFSKEELYRSRNELFAEIVGILLEGPDATNYRNIKECFPKSVRVVKDMLEERYGEVCR